MFTTLRSALWPATPEQAQRTISSYRIVPQHRDHGSEYSDLEKLAFIHHRTSIFNLGDYLSSPRHYFKITPKMGSRPTVVVGGGVYGNYQRFARAITGIDLAARARVGWGVGQSVSRKGSSGKEKTKSVAEAFDFLATRDPDFASEGAPFCPCASILNSIVDIPPGDRTGILLNFDTRASGPAPLALLRAFEGCVVGSNASSERDFRALFAQTDRIVTNSYHTAFWGLASGRAVGMIGFSSKYDSIRSMFGLDADYQRYRKGDDAGLGNAIRQVLQSDRFVRVPDAAEVKEKFRKLNFDVAERLVERGIFEAIAFVPDNELSLQRRADEVLSDYVLEEF